MKKKLTDRYVATLKPGAKRLTIDDTEMSRLKLRVSPKGVRTYFVVINRKGRPAQWIMVGDASVMPVEAARTAARAIVGRINEGLPAVETPAETFGQVAENWYQRHVLKNGHRTAKSQRSYLDRIILPAWRDRPITSIKRQDLSAMLDKVEDENGASSANNVQTVIGSIMTFHEERNDDFKIPRVKPRYDVKANARERVLTNPEIRALWAATETDSPHDNMVRMLLLTTQRLEKVRTMKWSDIEGDIWTIETATREKPNGEVLVLPPLALAVLDRMRARGLVDSPYVFAGRRRYNKPVRGAINGHDKAKKALGGRLPEDMPHWTNHDLRRTGRTLMGRVGVPHEHAERAVGHLVGNRISRIYDKHKYLDQKSAALRRLNDVIASIVDPTPTPAPDAKPSNVVKMRKAS